MSAQSSNLQTFGDSGVWNLRPEEIANEYSARRMLARLDETEEDLDYVEFPLRETSE